MQDRLTAEKSVGRFHYGWIVIFSGMLATIGAHGFGRMAYTLVLPEMREGLGLTYAQSGFLATGNFIGYLIFGFLGGFLAAHYGSRIVISISLVLMGVAMLLTGMVRSLELALLMRFLTGLGNGGAYVAAMALGSTWFAKRRSGFATGIVSGGIGAGTLISGLIVPTILLNYGNLGWRYAWFYLGGLVLIIALLCFIFLRNRPADLGLQVVGSPPLGETAVSPPASTPSPPAPVRKRPPTLQWELVYKVKEVWYLGLVYLMYGFSYVIYMTFFKAFLSDEIGLSAVQAGSMWALVGGLSVFCGVIWGGISDLLGRKYGAALAYLTLAAAYLIFAVYDTVPAFYVSVFLFGLSAWSIPTIMAATAGDYVGPLLAPAGVGFITLFFGLGQALGPWLGGYTADLTGTFTYSFILAASVSLAGVASALLLKKPASAEATAAAGTN
ncbi:MAG: MFS transporter [Bacillota bacterium]